MCVRVSSVPELTGGTEMAAVDKLTVGWLFKEVRLAVLREGGRLAMVTSCVVTALPVSEVSMEGQVGVAEVSGVPVAKVEVGEVMGDGGWVTELVTELGKVTRDVAIDVACVTGSVVSKGDNGVLCVVPAVTGFVLEPDTEGRTPFVVEVNTLLVTREGTGVPEASVSVGVIKEVAGGAESLSVPGDSIGRAALGVSVASPEGVAAGLGEGG